MSWRLSLKVKTSMSSEKGMQLHSDKRQPGRSLRRIKDSKQPKNRSLGTPLLIYSNLHMSAHIGN